MAESTGVVIDDHAAHGAAEHSAVGDRWTGGGRDGAEDGVPGPDRVAEGEGGMPYDDEETTDVPCGCVGGTAEFGAMGALVRTAVGKARDLTDEVRLRLMLAAAADDGMSTVEYAIGTIAAAAFGAVLYQVVTGDDIVSALSGIIDDALSTDV